MRQSPSEPNLLQASRSDTDLAYMIRTSTRTVILAIPLALCRCTTESGNQWGASFHEQAEQAIRESETLKHDERVERQRRARASAEQKRRAQDRQRLAKAKQDLREAVVGWEQESATQRGSSPQ